MSVEKSKNCPRCKEHLEVIKDIEYCKKHGVLLKAKQLEKMTNKNFSQVFWTKWFSLLQKGGLRCPSCLSRMIILNPATKKDLEVDCCPSCFAIWLDKGEGADLHFAFLTFEAERHSDEKYIKIAELQYLIGKEMIEIDERNQLYKKISAIGEMLNKRLPWYRGF